ncbi:bifunctional hydroxymethylpyrimidine kinase/phosphomethylpyrimidine kinase [Candidatus Nitrosopumilus sp. SW]|uniref:bifunctional hydroxymethylpyrimidine kinase/phosphomethylpyrimidine kinase n=1 Tax=Candidatus Nitrosopumilus sp. SW TaxID=2508726 RepID=UPI001152959A|nr:bifunctional hydroxymethylpyrimidine kinase/phosphomethylpyrimidine kinase [Candidatus Nitrosopumilus sp. SW]QDI88420.1 bifunctional hydroxymethylpyrimidine kinase/phosphomethylpyrimidine kinase [Candidatus Nitrosopumilus sp. SW]
MNILSIGGSDPSSGAGIQSDIRVFSKLGVHPLTAITAITSQNTSKFGIVEPVSPNMLKKQLDSIFSDFKIDGIKIGMVYNSKIIKIIYHQLKKLKIPIVVDPVIRSTTGGYLIENNATKDFQKYIIPLATIITPNKSEAEFLTKIKISTKNTPEKVAKIIQGMGAKNVVITGFEEKKNKVSDFVLEKNRKYIISGEKIPKTNHGSGCIHSAVIIHSLAKKKSVKESLYFAKKFTQNSIKNAKKIGKGIVITDIQSKKGIEEDLSSAINKFTAMKEIYKNIPECQTNFVFSKQKPRSTKDVLGISGRIVKAGKNVLVAGDLKYGGSKHVATALLSMNKKYPEICSAINLKYQNTTLSKIKKLKLTVSSYDRSKEPKNVKIQGSTIRWGINSAIKNSKTIPDVIYHKGDFGKEPMIIVFGKTPKDVLEKISKIKG